MSSRIAGMERRLAESRAALAYAFLQRIEVTKAMRRIGDLEWILYLIAEGFDHQGIRDPRELASRALSDWWPQNERWAEQIEWTVGVGEDRPKL